MKKTVVILMILTIFSKFLGFGRDIILSFFYGASNISDIFLISLTIPTIIFAIIGKSISVGFIPLYTEIEKNTGTKEANNYTNIIESIVVVFCLLIFILGQIFTEPIVKLFASGFEGETLELTVTFTRITLIGIFFTGLNYVYTSFLQVKGAYIIPTIIGIPSNLIIIATIYFSAHSNTFVLSIGSLISIASQFLLLFFFAYRKNYRFKLKFDFKNVYIKRMLFIALPAILGASVSQINLLIDRTMASNIAVGGITALNYASTLSLVVLGIFVLSISSVFYPNVSKLAAEKKIDQLKQVLSNSICAVIVFVIPISIGMMVFAEPIVKLLYARGHFDLQALKMTTSALFFYSIGIIGLSVREILTSTFYSFHDSKTPTINAIISMGLNIILNVVLSKFMGISGLAFASSISAIFSSILLLVSLKKKIAQLDIIEMVFSFVKILSISMIMGLVCKFVYTELLAKTNSILGLLFSICIGIAVYATLLNFMKIKQVNIVKIQIKNKLFNFRRLRVVTKLKDTNKRG